MAYRSTLDRLDLLQMPLRSNCPDEATLSHKGTTSIARVGGDQLTVQREMLKVRGLMKETSNQTVQAYACLRWQDYGSRGLPSQLVQ
ncbi:hypothetical protein NDU88_004612 [Pleurodeles waltl]|uniref:Uncharacterized protein n=1 Tax=Pleurodeles waltl TaxID=8319 RepID=A0AAV7V3H1_PLEWA|nr:hypothetical protein NDU88_004612 [Pleurodeles waltl]